MYNLVLFDLIYYKPTFVYFFGPFHFSSVSGFINNLAHNGQVSWKWNLSCSFT